MSELLITPDDLGVYLNDASVNEDRALQMIVDAQDLCESILTPLPDAAAGIVRRIAGRGYVTSTQARGSAQSAAMGTPFGAGPSGSGGVYLTRSDKADLRRLAGQGGAFSVDALPAGYVSPVVAYGWWDAAAEGGAL